MPSGDAREAFEEVPELYDRARPGYPDELFGDLADLADLSAGSRVLELGCGTGQATVPLAERAYEVVAVELGSGLAAVAKRKLAPYPRASVLESSFEEWKLPDEPFDLVLAATSFHWLDPTLRVAKAADALRRGGALAVVSTHHVAGGDMRFFADVQRCYQRWGPETPVGWRPPEAKDVPLDRDELTGGGRFERAVVRRYEHERTYSATEYRDLLLTYSDHRALAPAALRNLLACVVRLIDDRYGGSVVKRCMNQLAVAYRV